MSAKFQASQIVCLEDSTARLYAEVIQVISDRQCCWARPILMLRSPSNVSAEAWIDDDTSLHDLRDGADLLLPLNLFRAALDTEIIPLLMRLDRHKQSLEGDRLSRQMLREFVQQICTTYPEAFQS